MNIQISPNMYETLLSQMEANLRQDGYQRSGKGLMGRDLMQYYEDEISPDLKKDHGSFKL